MNRNFSLCICITVIIILLISCTSKEIKRTRMLEINPVDISLIKDGQYIGEYSYGSYLYKINVSIKNGKYNTITVLSNGKTKQAKMAEVFDNVLNEQRNDVDVISGATTTSKAFLKALENALENANR